MAQADFDLWGDGTVSPVKTGRGAGGGRPVGYSPKRGQAMSEADLGDTGSGNGEDRTSLSVRKVLAQTRDLEAKAALNELKLKIDSGKYLPREAYREATATMLASLAQSLRSLPDIMERKLGLPAEAVQLVEATLDESLAKAAETLALFHGRDEE